MTAKKTNASATPTKVKMGDRDNVIENTLNSHIWGVKTNNPLVFDFYNALKRQKVFGAFCSLYEMHELSAIEKMHALASKGLINIEGIRIKPIRDTKFIRRIKILSCMINFNAYDHSKGYSNMSLEKALGYYAKDYFKNINFKVKHSPLFYQFVFGTTSLIIGLLMLFGLVYYFWGASVLFCILILIFIYSMLGIYKLCAN